MAENHTSIMFIVGGGILIILIGVALLFLLGSDDGRRQHMRDWEKDWHRDND